MIDKVVSVCVQAREGAALRGTLQAEREAASAELQALKAVIQKLESQKHEKPQPCTVISEKEVEERRRAEEKAAQEILQLKQVGLQARQLVTFQTVLVMVVLLREEKTIWLMINMFFSLTSFVHSIFIGF